MSSKLRRWKRSFASSLKPSKELSNRWIGFLAPSGCGGSA
jgi:hypothetical protein